MECQDDYTLYQSEADRIDKISLLDDFDDDKIFQTAEHEEDDTSSIHSFYSFEDREEHSD